MFILFVINEINYRLQDFNKKTFAYFKKIIYIVCKLNFKIKLFQGIRHHGSKSKKVKHSKNLYSYKRI